MKYNKDGLARDWRKLKDEWRYLESYMRPHRRRWFKKPWDSHAYVNLFVEACRASPYLVGHVLAWAAAIGCGWLIYALNY